MHIFDDDDEIESRMDIEREAQKQDEYWDSKKLECIICGEIDLLDDDGICPVCNEVAQLEKETNGLNHEEDK